MIMAKMSDGFQSLKQSAGRVGESMKAKTVETRVNMIVNRKLQQPFKALKQTRRVAIQQLAELYKNNKISTSEFDAIALQYETQLVAGANEALRNMGVDHMQLGEKIKHLRQSNKMSQSDLAKSLHVSYQAISNWERNKKLP